MDKRKLLPKRQRTDDGRVMRTGPLNGKFCGTLFTLPVLHFSFSIKKKKERKKNNCLRNSLEGEETGC